MIFNNHRCHLRTLYLMLESASWRPLVFSFCQYLPTGLLEQVCHALHTIVPKGFPRLQELSPQAHLALQARDV